MKLIETLSFNKIRTLIDEAENHLYISLPSIDEKLANVLIESEKVQISQIILDNSEESIRNGFGEVAGIVKLRTKNFRIFESNGNLVSFIISDDNGYFLFPQSKIFLDEPKGPNAYKLDPVTIQLLIKSFFPFTNLANEPSPGHDSIEDSIKHFELAFKEIQVKGTEVGISPFDENKFGEIQKKLEANPALSPDLQRQINTYSAKIQFVELKFKGGNLENRIAQLPKKALPINSDELKNLLLTRIKMFHDIDSIPEYKNFKDFKDKIEVFRLQYLTPITCRPGKSILKIQDKAAFLDGLNALKEESKIVTKNLTSMLEIGQLNTKELLRKELLAFFKTNEPEEVKKFQTQDYKDKKINDIIEKIVNSVYFPDAPKLIQGISLKDIFYALTWDDFQDEELLDEFLEKEIMEEDDINSIVNLKKVYAVKK